MPTRSIRRDMQKLVWVSLTALAAVCVIFAAKQFFETSIRSKIAAEQDLLEMVYRLENQFLMARRAEKDFLLRKDAKYLERHSGITQEMAGQIDLIETQVQSFLGNQADKSQAELRASVDQYTQSFATLVDTNMTLGLDEESGLQGTLRSAVKTAETSLKEFDNPLLQVKMLMMRRHEKDFIMRGDQKYVDRLNARVAEFQEFPTSEYPSSDVQTQVLGLMQDYQIAFNEYAG